MTIDQLWVCLFNKKNKQMVVIANINACSLIIKNTKLVFDYSKTATTPSASPKCKKQYFSV